MAANIAQLRTILHDYFRARHDTDISSIDTDALLKRTMASVVASAPPNTPVVEINKQTLRLCRDAIHQQQQASPYENLLMQRQKELEMFLPQAAPTPTPTPTPAPVHAPLTSPSTVICLSSAMRDPRHWPSPCRFTICSAVRRGRTYHNAYTNNALVPGTSSTFSEGYPNTHGFTINGQTFSPFAPDKDAGAVHAMSAVPLATLTDEPPSLHGMTRIQIERIMLGTHNRAGEAPAALHLGKTLFVAAGDAAGHTVYLPAEDPTEIPISNGRVEVDITAPHQQDRPAWSILEGEPVTIETTNIKLARPLDVRQRDIVRILGACVYTLPGGDEEVTRDINAWLSSPHTVVSQCGTTISISSDHLTDRHREALAAFPHPITGFLFRPMNQISIIGTARA